MIHSPQTKKEEAKYSFVENIDYSKTSVDQSIWGSPRDGVIQLCGKTDIHGCWLDLGAGDGRYIGYFLSKCDAVTALDIDDNALEKLRNRFPSAALQTVVHNVVQQLPFQDAEFNGVICTGLLHYFPPNVTAFVFREVHRILKPSGVFLFDFSTNVVRKCVEASVPKVRRGHEYSDTEAQQLWHENEDIFDFEIEQEDVFGKPMLILGRRFSWSSRDFQVRAQKQPK